MHFLNMCLCRQRTETLWKPMQTSIKNHNPSRLLFVEMLIDFGIDVRTRNFEVLGSILASISASIWGQVGRLGASWGRLVPCLRDDLDVLVTQGLASWQNVMDLTRNSRGTHAQLTATRTGSEAKTIYLRSHRIRSSLFIYISPYALTDNSTRIE